MLLDTNSVIKKLEQRGFSRAQAEGITDALRELDASSLVKTDLELALARTTTTIITWTTGALLAQGALVVALFESVGYRRAYRYRARRVYGHRAYGYATPRLWHRSIEYANPNVYPTGSRAWWAVMNRQGRGGRPD